MNNFQLKIWSVVDFLATVAITDFISDMNTF